MDAGLEVPVARQHGGGHEIVLHHGLLDRRRERARVADAGRAAITHRLEAELVEVGRETGLVEVVGDDAGPGRKRGLDHRVHAQAFLDGLLGQQASREHDARVGGVGAAGDRGDQHGAVTDLRAVHLRADGGEFLGLLAKAIFGHRLRERIDKGLLHLRQFDAVLRALRAGDARDDGRKVKINDLGVVDRILLRDAPQALRLVVGLVGGDVFLLSSGGAEIVGAFGVDREEAHGRSVFGRHVGDGRTINDWQGGGARAEELDKLADDLGFAHQLRDGEREVRGGDTLAKRTRQVHADDVGCEEINRLAEHAGLGLDTADAPAHDAEAVDHRGVRIGADERIGIVDAVLAEHTLGEIFEIHLVDDADARRDDLKGVEGLHAPFEKLVALPVAFEFKVEVLGERLGVAGKIHLHGVIHHEINRHERLDDLGVLAELGHGRAHGGEVDQQRHSGEILQHDACDHERDFGRAGLGRLPVGQLPDVGLHDPLAIAVAQHGLQNQPDTHGQARDRGELLRQLG